MRKIKHIHSLNTNSVQISEGGIFYVIPLSEEVKKLIVEGISENSI